MKGKHTDWPVSGFKALEIDAQIGGPFPVREGNVGVEIVDGVMVQVRAGDMSDRTSGHNITFSVGLVNLLVCTKTIPVCLRHAGVAVALEEGD